MSNNSTRKTVFEEIGLKETVNALIKKTQDIYLSDDFPWVVGYSGGKDSTAALQIIWHAIAQLSEDKRTKSVHVISTDTLVENPIVANWVRKSLEAMEKSRTEKNLPIYPHRLIPAVKDRFWVNLIGRGYPAPRPKFRWCTHRLKISPSNEFIKNLVDNYGEAILVLGTRSSESTSRASNAVAFKEGILRRKKRDSSGDYVKDGDGKNVVETVWEKYNTRKDLDLNVVREKELDRVWSYTPISDWHDDDVWQYLMQVKNPWGYKNQDLLGMYQGATDGGECPLVVDTSTPSCGDSRFGCYVCTLVGEDKSMAAMIQNDQEKEWMLPLVELKKKWLDITASSKKLKDDKIDLDRENRDFRRMDGTLTLYRDRLVHGPYKQSFRANILEDLLHAELAMKEMLPEEIKDIELISLEELEEINRIWFYDKHEVEELLPQIFEKVKGMPYPGKRHNASYPFKMEDLMILKEICEQNEGESEDEGILYESIRNLLHVEHESRTMVKRASHFKKLEKVLARNIFTNEKEAEEFALRKQKEIAEIDQSPEQSDIDFQYQIPIEDHRV